MPAALDSTGAWSPSRTSSCTPAPPGPTSAISRTCSPPRTPEAEAAARALIVAVAGWARERGCGRVYWSTHETNATARRLYDDVAANRGFIRYEIAL
jgi:Acetyltransferase (GNAT) family